jgi:ribonuclease HI
MLVTIITSGETLNSGLADARSGITIYYGQDDPRNDAFAMPDQLEQSTINAELAAALFAAQKTDLNTPLRLESRRETVLMTKDLEKNEDRGWIGVKNKGAGKALAAALKQRRAATTIAVVKKDRRTENASDLARAACRDVQIPPKELNLEIPHEFKLPGAKLSKPSQALAYKGIKELNTKVSRKTTSKNITDVQDALSAQYTHAPTASTIWKSLRSKGITRQIRTFLWKSMHGAHKIGKYWEHIPDCEERAICQHCEVTETLCWNAPALARI